MGAEQFDSYGEGREAQGAFDAAVADACYNYGHAGYTGTIAEKTEFTLITKTPMPYDAAQELATKLLDDGDERVDDKWGPAGAIPVHGKDDPAAVQGYLFFGWASS